MKKRTAFALLASSSIFAGSAFADVEDRDGVYDLQCDSATLTFSVASGIGSIDEDPDSIIIDVEGQTVNIDIPAGCDDQVVDTPPSAAWTQQIIDHCENNLEIPTGWGITCDYLATEITEWAIGLGDSIGRAEFDQFYTEIDPPRNWFQRLIGYHPSTIELTRIDGSVTTKNTGTYGSGSFDFSIGLRNPVLGGIAGFSCLGGIGDNIDGQVVELGDGSFFGYGEEDNTAALACSKDLGEERLAVSLSLHLETLYSGPNVSGN